MAAEGSVEELLQIVRDVQERVRARHIWSGGTRVSLPLPDLTPILQARDAAEGKVAAIGKVNPRPGGLVNDIAQSIKRFISRSLDWFVREQVEFNRASLRTVQATMDVLDEYNRVLVMLAEQQAVQIEELKKQIAPLHEDAIELRDIRSNWQEWRKAWEVKLATNEVQFLRAVADLNMAFQQRTATMESKFRELQVQQHRDFEGALERTNLGIQRQLYEDLDKIKTDYEKLIHSELRTARQRIANIPAMPAPASAMSSSAIEYDALRFADRFRGSEEYVRQGQQFYKPFFEGRRNVVDIGCGRGEFLGLMRELGVTACGIDLDPENVALCRNKGFEAETADLFDWLSHQPIGSLGGVFCSQVIEHLQPGDLPRFLKLASEALAPGGVIALETPNPECLAIFATHFYLDPTHTRPVPAKLAAFYLEETGFGRIEVHYRAAAVESIPEIAELPEKFRETFFGGLDYSIIGTKL